MPKILPDNKTHHLNYNSSQNQEKIQKDKTTHGDLRQDKRAETRARLATDQPAHSHLPMRAKPEYTKTHRTQNSQVHKRRTVQLTLWISPIEKAEIQRRATRENLSVSSVGAALLRKGMQADLDMQYGALLEPVFASLLTRHMESRDNRLALLLVRNYLVGEQTRGLVTNLLGRHPAIIPEVLNDILDTSFQDAKKKLIRRSPELEALIKEVKSWVIREERGEAQKRKE